MTFCIPASQSWNGAKYGQKHQNPTKISPNRYLTILLGCILHSYGTNPGGGRHSHLELYVHARTARVLFWPILILQRVSISISYSLDKRVVFGLKCVLQRVRVPRRRLRRGIQFPGEHPPGTNEALLGGATLTAPFDIFTRSPCSLPFFGTRSFLQIFTAPFSSLFAPCSFLIFPLAP